MEIDENVMVDTSAFYAFISESDRFHSEAVAIFGRLADDDIELWTTSYALVETIALVHRRLGFQSLADLLEFIESKVSVVWVESSIHDMAMREFKAQGGRGLSLVDWTVVLAARMQAAEVFTFDGGIANAGVSIVPLP